MLPLYTTSMGYTGSIFLIFMSSVNSKFQIKQFRSFSLVYHFCLVLLAKAICI